jgi:3'(2'), 5'-bisphosphate nucleotidase
MREYAEILPALMDLLRPCGDYLLECSQRIDTLSSHQKTDGSEVTEADLHVNHEISHGLEKLMPSVPILSEEGALAPWETRRTWERYWLIDPLDGTRAFVQGQDDYCICVALIEHGKPVLGMLYGPKLNEWYYGACGLGSFQIKGDQAARQLQSEPHQRSLTCLVSRREIDHPAQRALTQSQLCCKVKAMSSALKFGRIAAGEAQLYCRIGPTSQWDTAAGQCVLEQAGGIVVDMKGHRLGYHVNDTLINPSFMALNHRRDQAAVQKILCDKV